MKTSLFSLLIALVCDPLLAEAIKRIHKEESISCLFD